MSSLRRTMAAGFTLDNSVSLQQVQAASDPTDLLLPVDDYFSDKERLTLDPAAEKKVRNGMTVGMPGPVSYTHLDFRPFSTRSHSVLSNTLI